MRSRTGFTTCLVLMIVIALVEFRAPTLHPLTSLDRALALISDHTDLAHTLQAAQRAADGR